MNSSITKRWVRGSLLFTLAVVLVAEGLFLYFTINSYYRDARQAIQNQFSTLRDQLLPAPATAEERSQKLVNLVESFENKGQFELMLVNSAGGIEATSSGVIPAYTEIEQDIVDAHKPGGSGAGYFAGRTITGEKVMAITSPTPYQAGGVVSMRLVTSLTRVDTTIRNIVIASVALLGAIILASIISGIYFIRSIVFPLQKIEASASRIAEGDFDIRIDNTSSDEIGSLSQTINHMAEELGKSERMKNEFISSVSHELRTPLTSIKGWTETVSRLSDPANPSFRRGIEIIGSEADRLYDMVEELLDFSRMQNGLSLKPELLDLAAEVEEAVLLSGQRAAELGVALLYTAQELPVPVMADRNRIRQVMVNVLDNAIKYSFTGGEVNVEIQPAEEAGHVRVVVADEGQGISPEDLENVRVKFYKGRGAVRGSGIGLAVVDEIVTAHGGRLNIESELNRGTTVTVELPLYIKEKAADGKTGTTA